jgi:hypothetical protein
MMQSEDKRLENMRNYPVPGLPDLPPVAEMKLDGPFQAHKFFLLWELMLCNQNKQRMDRLEIRDNTVRTKDDIIARVPDVETVSKMQTTPVIIPEHVPDRVWQSLYMQTSVQLPFSVHAALWAPFTDPETGKLPEEGLHEHIHARIPETLLNKPLTWRQAEWLRRIFNLNEPKARYVGGPRMACSLKPPVWIHKDGDDNPHSHEGPAAVWEDGSSAYMWRGRVAPVQWFKIPTKQWLDDPARKGCPVPVDRGIGYHPPKAQEALRHENLELRRIACELLGWDEILKELPHKVVDTDPDPMIGTLLRVQMPTPSAWNSNETTQQQFLRVQCGTGRTFSLAVPPDIRSAKAANAWTYGLSPEEYEPEIRT